MLEIVKTIRGEVSKVYSSKQIYIETVEENDGCAVTVFIEGKPRHQFIIDYQQYFHAVSPHHFIVEIIKEQLAKVEDKKQNGG